MYLELNKAFGFMFINLSAEKYTIGTAFFNKNLNNSIIFKNFKFDIFKLRPNH